jgi:predicted RNA-binding protein with RPS1 domain
MKEFIADAANADVFETSGKYNNQIKLSEHDKKSGVKIYCMEPYAQEMYDRLSAYEKGTGRDISQNKDLSVDTIYEVFPTKIDFENKYILAEEVNSKIEIVVPFKEFSRSIDDLVNRSLDRFIVMLYKSDASGEFLASEKKCTAINYRKELNEHYSSNTWFSVQIKKLIKGGYLALYKDTIECFIPGSHAAANVISNFSDLLNTTINVMVDNYDSTNDLFILSYKKYIKQSMPAMVTELKFGERYTGTLTTKPYDFGIFVEFNNYYTGLIHASEFKDYNSIKSSFKAGDKIDFYVKNVTSKGKEYRIVLTLNPDEIDPEKLEWDQLRSKTENQSFEYEVDSKNNSIKIYIDGSFYEVTLKRKDLEANINKYPKVRVSKVDPINKKLKFEFIESQS